MVCQALCQALEVPEGSHQVVTYALHKMYLHWHLGSWLTGLPREGLAKWSHATEHSFFSPH